METVFNLPETLLAVMEQTSSFTAIIAFSSSHKRARNIICSPKGAKQLFKAKWDNPLFYGPLCEWPPKLGVDISNFDGLQYLCFARHLEKQFQSECKVERQDLGIVDLKQVIDIKTGEEIKSPPLSMDYHYRQQPAFDPFAIPTRERIYYLADIVLSIESRRSYIGFCKKTKKQLWSFEVVKDFVSSLDVQNYARNAIMILTDGTSSIDLKKRVMHGVDLKDGSILWTKDVLHLFPPEQPLSFVIVRDKFVYSNNRTGNASVVIDIQTGKDVFVLNHEVLRASNQGDYLFITSHEFVHKYKEDNNIFTLMWKTALLPGLHYNIKIYHFSNPYILLLMSTILNNSDFGLKLINKEGSIIWETGVRIGTREIGFCNTATQIRGRQGIIVQSLGHSRVVCEHFGWDGSKKWRAFYKSA